MYSTSSTPSLEGNKGEESQIATSGMDASQFLCHSLHIDKEVHV